MTQILDQHHDILVCSQCQKYLSVFPIKVYEDGRGDVKCGRCCANDDNGIASILYEKLAKKCLFKCVNRYEGCRKLLLPSEIALHETTCIGRNYNCPNCEAGPQMSINLLIHHFKLRHTKYFLTSNIFYLTLSRSVNKEKFFYVQDDNIFIIVIRFVPNKLHISAVTLCKLENVKQQFRISVDSLAFENWTAKTKCISLENFNNDNYCKVNVSNILNQNVKFEIILDMSETLIRSYEVGNNKSKTKPQAQPVDLTPEFIRRYPTFNLTTCGRILYSKEKPIELRCSNCKQMMAYDIFICASNIHLTCWDCWAWCGLCNCPIKGLHYEVGTLSKFLLFSCKWKCSVKCAAIDLRKHEKFCEMNKQKCPICYSTITEKYLSNHLSAEHQCMFNQEFNLSLFLKSQRQSGDNYYFVISNNVFKIKWDMEWKAKQSEKMYTQFRLHVTPCDDMTDLELFVIMENNCYKFNKGVIKVILENNPKLYLKYFH